MADNENNDPRNPEIPDPSTDPDFREAARAGTADWHHRPHRRHRRLWHRAMTIGSLAVLIGAVLYTVVPPAAGARGWFGGPDCHGRGPGPHGFGPGGPDAKAMRYHALYMTERALDEVDADDAQREVVLGIVERAAGDLAELRDDHEELREEFMEAILTPTVDRAALESLRKRKVEAMAAASERVVGAIADVAEVLSVEQRKELADYVRSRHEGRWGHHGPGRG
jgi:Spy/CpxP family protein refolding chaperone